MSDHLKKVKSGDPLKIPAATFNTFVDTARDYQARKHQQGQGSRAAVRHSGLVLVKNASGADRQRFDVLGVNGPIFAPADAEDAFKNAVALIGGPAMRASSSSCWSRSRLFLIPLRSRSRLVIGQSVQSV